MILKEIFSSKILDRYKNNKLLNCTNYKKGISRSLDEENIAILDFHDHFELKKNVLEGMSIKAQIKFYLNQKSNIFNFLYSSTDFNKFTPNFLRSFQKSLHMLTDDIPMQFKTFLLLNTVKGGYTVYSNGISGFLPGSHGDGIIGLIEMREKRKRNLQKKHKCSDKNIIRFRIPLILGKATFYGRAVTGVNIKRRKYKILKNRSNFVFLCPLDKSRFKRFVKFSGRVRAENKKKVPRRAQVESEKKAQKVWVPSTHRVQVESEKKVQKFWIPPAHRVKNENKKEVKK